jgi:hypothetical protein
MPSRTSAGKFLIIPEYIFRKSPRLTSNRFFYELTALFINTKDRDDGRRHKMAADALFIVRAPRESFHTSPASHFSELLKRDGERTTAAIAAGSSTDRNSSVSSKYIRRRAGVSMRSPLLPSHAAAISRTRSGCSVPFEAIFCRVCLPAVMSNESQLELHCDNVDGITTRHNYYFLHIEVNAKNIRQQDVCSVILDCVC